ncbi:M61 family metallopeptidase [Fulvivirga ligni]|uniref:M61 family metallopeptidase n=1 Tax=Fulvivirga ligni TaxID=2904246 RepID=UPI001F3B7075|nr:M61 family peptidase [Fulvivirga ligni]UII21976.1 M61 family peptidase [Fulvivirga ligni]
MQYNISFPNPLQHFFEISVSIDTTHKSELEIFLPIWRPGRYEAANFSKYLRDFKIESEAGDIITHRKTSSSSWKIDASSEDTVIVKYKYWAYRMDAGSSWFDEDLIYINFVNCMVYVKELMTEPCEIVLDLPENFKVGCGLKRQGNKFEASDYYELADSPLIASAELEHLTYTAGDTDFHVWISGKHSVDSEKIVTDFKKFSESQIQIMGEFPEPDYHFILIMLPFKFYHGVEHHDSTVICLGPGIATDIDELYTQLIGVSSHELFHSWNILKIRPKELMPYEYNKEAFFPTGYVAEGFTTYYGDLFLAKSGVFDQEAYFTELNTLFKRHFYNFGRLNYSVADSSEDLWIDGYALNFPDRKSSIYVEGAMVALCLDLMIRKSSSDEKSLDDVLKKLYVDFGKTGKGYTSDDVQQICEELYGDSLSDFFQRHVFGTDDKEELINGLLSHVGCMLWKSENTNPFENYLGIRLSSVGDNKGGLKVSHIAPGAIGEGFFSINDEIVTVNNQPLTIETIEQFDPGEYTFLVKRSFDKTVTFTVKPGEQRYFPQYKITPLLHPTPQQRDSFESWTGLKLA